MCGIAGIFDGQIASEEYPAVLDRMAASIIHRGPDEGGALALPQLRAGLASRRLSIIDIAGGQQPVANEDETVHVVFNGEIYNHVELRHELESRGHTFRSHCDTEVIVHAYEEWDLDALDRFHGMFALAVLDTNRHRLVLSRDSAGMKHLYWAQTDSGLIFGSEIKALLASGFIEPQVDPAAIQLYLSVAFTPAPLTGFLGIRKLPAAGFLVADDNGVREGTFWTPRYSTDTPLHSEHEYAEEMERLLRAAVKSHLAADVPVGAFISGGWDSSLVAAFAAEQTSRRLKTFSIIFPDAPQADESRYSRLLAKQLDSDHEETEFRAADAPTMYRDVVRHLEEPNSRAPVLLFYQLSRAAGSKVKSVLAGEGSDELFAGYEWFQSKVSRMAHTLRPITSKALARLALPYARGARAHLLLGTLAARDETETDIEWLRCMSPTINSALIHSDIRSATPDLRLLLPHQETIDSYRTYLDRLLSLEQHGRLADGILLEADKMSMAHSLESRMPFLDRSVVEFSMRLPSNLKLRGNQEKHILKPLTRHLPPEIAQRKKWGLQYPRTFNASMSRSESARELLLDSPKNGGILDRDAVEKFLNDKDGLNERSAYGIGSLVLLQTWWNEFIRR